MDFVLSWFGIAFLLAMLWSNIFSQSLYDDGNRNYEEINRDSKLVVIQSLLHNTETTLKEKVNHLQEKTNRETLMTKNFNEMISIYRTKKVPNGRLNICLNPNTISCRLYVLFCNVKMFEASVFH